MPAGPPPITTTRRCVAAGCNRIGISAPASTLTVQKVRGNDKTYRCPGCQQEIAGGTPHVVAWADDSLFGAEAALAARRHWHTACWDRG